MNEKVRNNRYFATTKEFRRNIDNFFHITLPNIGANLNGRINENFPTVVDFSTSPESFKIAKEAVKIIFMECCWQQQGHTMMLDSLIRILLLQVSRKAVFPHKRDKNHRRATFVLFQSLVEKHYKEKWAVADYAKQMLITEKRLNVLCQTFKGTSAFEVIQGCVMLEAQRLLIYTKASIVEITYELGFNDPAYFCRFFKKSSGLTPKLFKKSKSD
jgi:AraC family transcriptional activator of pobA